MSGLLDEITGVWHRYVHKKTYNPREQTPLEQAVGTKWDETRPFLNRLPAAKDEQSLQFLPELDGAIFCGHVVADLDSIAGAIGAAELYGGIPARASDCNAETKFALKYWKCDPPDRVEDLLDSQPETKVCLVDFQQISQLHDAIPMGNIVAVIDHHALQSGTIVTERPIFVDIRPWGSVSTIIAHSYALQGTFLPRKTAGMLLSAILSDTLNLRSPTTTEWDKRMVTMLVQYVGLEDVNMFAAAQFRAKSRELTLMSPYALVNGDMKTFKFKNNKGEYCIGYSVVETTDAEASLDRAEEIIAEMQFVRAERELTAMLLAIVDIVNLRSELLVCGPVEASLAIDAYGGDLRENVLELPGMVSRKMDFVPPITRVVCDGWTPPKGEPMRQHLDSQSSTHSVIIMDYNNFPQGQPVRVLSNDRMCDEED
jgi:inorganic pyrophosphatase/exopolyphosphatase